MTQLEEKERRFQEAARELRTAEAEAQAIKDRVRVEEARRTTELHEAQKVTDEADIKVFESLMGGNKKAAEFAVAGRPESRF